MPRCERETPGVNILNPLRLFPSQLYGLTPGVLSSKGAQGLTVGPYRSTYSRILQFHRDQASDSGEVVTPFMQDGTYPTRNFATLGPVLTYSRLSLDRREQTASRRSQPSSRIASKGELSFPGNLLHFPSFLSSLGFLGMLGLAWS